ncbi:610_t:CDS:1, partial [Cetraspora pellucida]
QIKQPETQFLIACSSWREDSKARKKEEDKTIEKQGVSASE